MYIFRHTHSHVGTPWWVGAKAPKSINSSWLPLPKNTSSTDFSQKTCKSNSADSQEEAATAVHDRFFVVETSSSQLSLSKLSPFAVEKSLKAAVGTVRNIRRLRDGNILVEVANAAQSRNIMKLNTRRLSCYSEPPQNPEHP